MGIRLLPLLLISFLFQEGFSAPHRSIKPKKTSKIKEIGSLVKIEKKISNMNTDLSSLRKKMNDFEDSLNKKNNSLIKSLKRKKNIEHLIERISYQIKTLKYEIDKNGKIKKNLLKKLVVENLSNSNNPGKILSNKIIIETVNKEINLLKLKSNQLTTLVSDLDKFEKEYLALSRNERALSDALRYLESQKQSLARDFLLKRNEKEVLESKYNKLKTQFVVGASPKKVKNEYSIPLEKYVKMDYKNKGITFFFREEGPVLSPKAGNISYSGRLSTYGNVVIVDHGQEMRSVILGSFIPKIKKGSNVKKGQLIGYSKSSGEDLGKVYFEVRQKDKVQNTIYLVEKKFLSRNKSNKI
ncbi:MAG: M23 family metallopeptidase [Bdellovibrionales bacterium]|jgi:septal ring factor EnvC (AmiA/AmiB activator)|nr:M23 family metallopeptidase [Bdellovibrionales bacterium]